MLPEALRVRMKRIIHECKISKTIQLQLARYPKFRANCTYFPEIISYSSNVLGRGSTLTLANEAGPISRDLT